MTYYSHVERDKQGTVVWKRPLHDHVQDVQQNMQARFAKLPMQQREALLHLIDVVGLTHDFGKYTSYFQRYLLTGKREGELHYHSFVGALLGSYWLTKTLDRVESLGHARYLPLLVYLVVLSHHGNLYSLDQLLLATSEDIIREKGYIKQQIADLLGQIEPITEDVGRYATELATILPAFLHEWEEHLASIIKLRYKLFNRERETSFPTLHLYTHLLFSLLIDADKHSAAQTLPVERKNIHPGIVDQWKQAQSFIPSALNQMRQLVYDTVLAQVEQAELGHSFYSLTSPTGTGKTLTSLAAALRLRERIYAETGERKRIVYVLPFTSIIEQNHDVFTKVLSVQEGYAETPEQYVLKHHHLAPITYKTKTKAKVAEDTPLHKQLLMIESWESEIIVTTYVQFLHTLMGYQNKQLKKMHNLMGAIVLLDEVQNIPFRYWRLSSELFRMHAAFADTKFVLLTATKPGLLQDVDVREWLTSPEHPNEWFFQQQDRTGIKVVDIEGLAPEEWMERAKEIVAESRSALLILNTIAASQAVYEALQQAGFEHVYYLSANMATVDRTRVLRFVSRRLKRQLPVILVSTQVVEAGVDVDFQVVIRDLAPIDSIIQAAGRCNRNQTGERGFLYVMARKSKTRRDADLIYGCIDVGCAKEALRAFAEQHPAYIPESRYGQLVTDYFNRLAKRKSSDESKQFLEAVGLLEYDNPSKTALSNFSLIAEQGDTHPAFIMCNGRSEKLWEQYETTVRQEKDIQKRTENYLRIKSALQEFSLNVPVKYIGNAMSLEEYGFVLIRREYISQYYSRVTGWIREEGDQEAFFL